MPDVKQSARAARILINQAAEELGGIGDDRVRDFPMPGMIGLSPQEVQRYSFFRAIRAILHGGQFVHDAAFEYECARQVAKQLHRDFTSSILIPTDVLRRPLQQRAVQRALATQPGSAGGFLVGVENLGFIDILRNRSVAINMGAQVVSGLRGNAAFARKTGKANVTWQAGDGSTVTATDQALGQLSMTPKTCVAITDISEQLLMQSSPSAEDFVMADLASDIAIDGLDAAVINGAGGAEPLGIKKTTGVTTGQDAANATYAKILDFVQTAGAANAIGQRPGFVTNIGGAIALMQVQRFTSTDTPVWTGNALDGQLVGFRAMSSEQLAANNLIFGSWDHIVIGEWGVLELAIDHGGTRFNALQVGIRGMWMVDVLLRYPQAFVVSTNLS
jgi:HK97 family phage major capsid protein